MARRTIIEVARPGRDAEGTPIDYATMRDNVEALLLHPVIMEVTDIPDVSGTPSDGDILVYDYGLAEWAPQPLLVFQGSGSPNGVVTAPVGSLYLRSDGGVGTSLYVKESGAGDTGWVAYSGDNDVPNPAIIAPVGLALDASNNSAMASNSSYAIYMGKADRAYISLSVRLEVTVAAATITWAELGIGTSPHFNVGSSVNITRRGVTDVAGTFNSTGEKTVSVTVSGINRGDNIWLLAGSQAATPFQVQAAIGGLLSASQIQISTATRISTMSSPKAFTAAFNNAGFYALMGAP